jgi:dihydrofolate reductase
MISIIAAMDQNRVIGLNNHLPWRLPNDLRRFKALTMGKPVIMGRKTHESIGKALPGRRNIVLSSHSNYQSPGCETALSFAQALEKAGDAEEVMVIGGAAVYEAALPQANRLYITLIEEEYVGDTWFPWYDKRKWVEVSREEHPADDTHEVPFGFLQLDRKEVSPLDEEKLEAS